MAALWILIGVLAITAGTLSAELPLRANGIELTLEPLITGGFHLVLTTGDVRTVYGHIGRTLYSPFTSEDIEGGVLVHIGSANLTVRTVRDDAADARGIKIKWDSYEPLRFEDCFDFGSKHWYAGPMQIDQIYPIEGAQQNYSAYVSKETDNGAIVERYWLNSAGEYIYVNPQVPLFVDYYLIQPNHICFGAQQAAPYSSRRNHTELSYDFWLLADVKKAHKHAVAHYLGKPSGLPDFRMVQHPIWSTWAQYSQNITEEKVLEYAQQIVDYGFNNSQLEIDDLWETCYGTLEVDTNKFPNLTNLVEEVKALGFRVTIWVHPFINNNCEEIYTEALNNGYLVLDEAGTAAANWWNPNGSIPGLVDFTKPAAAEWWYRRVNNLIDTYGIDSIKFDAGESSFSPQIPVQEGDIDLHPHNIVDAYVRTCARFGDMVEVRAGFRTQDLPIFVRMVDRDSIWGLNNGLPTIVTTTIQMNLNGYPLVLPDMIGGNGFNLNHPQADLPSKELFIRWVQANTFLPAMQYSFAPWNFDNETVEISKKFTELHAEYAEVIYAAMQAAVDDGSPVNPPLWWLDPSDQEALTIWDEYLLGENILVAPVFREGITVRDVYLPTGRWFDQGDPEKVREGPIWIRNYPAPIGVLPYFVRDPDTVPDSASDPFLSVVLIVLGLAVVFNLR
ncbi:myogenesis-regulating glycosidase-like [Bicyclus anynana]|uniref:Myogenesis-regulating glycosidase-like n=1 Tax=Bicyclus anynana TaxID=110368 RepID=A0A6J1N7S3_BICAN|nr:myogenesis-regulating glycosidase-like [Bicyclus anynana]